MAQLDAREAAAHRKATTMSTADVAAFLQEIFGQKLVAFMTDADAKTVRRWSEGTPPRAEAESRLRAIQQIYELLVQVESPHTIRAWFIGMNPQLADDLSPSEAIREGNLRDALAAAKAFMSGG